jgi:hypothetical protein
LISSSFRLDGQDPIAIPLTMAGRVRQPIDEAAFSKFLSDNVPEIKLPIDLKQVCGRWHLVPTPVQ